MTLTSTLRIHDTFEQLYPYFAIKKPYYDMACTHQVPSDGLLAQLIQILIAKARTNNRISRSCIQKMCLLKIDKQKIFKLTFKLDSKMIQTN